MKVSHSIAIIPPAPQLSSLEPGQVFEFIHGNGGTYMVVSPWSSLQEDLDRDHVGGIVVFVSLESGILYNSKEMARPVRVMHAEVLIA